MSEVKEVLIKKVGDCSNMDQSQRALSGEYYVMDPCYIIPSLDGPHDMWGDCCFYWDWEETGGAGRDWIAFEIRGHRIFAFTTAHGDGYYDVLKQGTEIGGFGVDSGIFAFVPKELFELDDWGRVDREMSEPLVRIDCDFTMHKRGVVTVGDLTIDTD